MRYISKIAKIISWVCMELTYGFAKDKRLLSPGTVAPDFVLTDSNGNAIHLNAYRNKKYVVLIFYPGDETPVCTQQLCAIRDDFRKFSEKNAVVFGINPSKQESHRKFAEKNNYQFPLLVDKDSKVALQYGAQRAFMNKRTVYVVAIDGKIIFARRGKPNNEEILKNIP